MRHVYECPTRWADLDLLGHVNNVVFVDYLQEARVDMLRVHAPEARSDDLAEGVVVVSHSVTYLRPLHFRLGPVLVDCWVSDIKAATFTLACELYDPPTEPGGERVVYARATTVLTPYIFATERPRRLAPEEKERLRRFLEPGFEAHPPRVRPPSGLQERAGAGHYPMHVRFSDVDAYRHVNNVKYFEFLQESRIAYLVGLEVSASTGAGADRAGRDGHGGSGPGMVLAHVDMAYRLPILHRSEPYDIWSAVTRVGRTSFQVATEIRDGDRTLAGGEVTVVFFDPRTERATEPSAQLRALLVSAAGEGEQPAG